MFNYLGNITDLYHNIIKEYCLNKAVAVDATLGNGGDCDFLCDNFQKVYAFDIQQSAVDKYSLKNLHNVEVICDSHSNMNKYIKDQVDIIIFNLGFLPGGDKHITTEADTTIEAIRNGLTLLRSQGMMIIAVYTGHEEGEVEGQAVMDYVAELPKNQYGVMLHRVINRSKSAPFLLLIEKK